MVGCLIAVLAGNLIVFAVVGVVVVYYEGVLLGVLGRLWRVFIDLSLCWF